MPKADSALPISVVINTKNAAATLAEALASVQAWVQEVIVVDMLSEDDTAAIAKKAGARVVNYPENLEYADPARNFANDQAHQPWVLVLDADEAVPVDLQQWIAKRLAEPSAQQVACFWLPRQNLMFGQWVAHTGWWPDYQPRLFQAGRVKWQLGVHRMPEVTGQSEYVPAEPQLSLLHQNYRTVEEFIAKLNRYTNLKARERAAEKSSAAPTPVAAVFFNEFWERCFHQAGTKDGEVGVALSLLQATYELTAELKYREATHQLVSRTSNQAAVDQLATLQQVHRQLGYWLADAQVKQTTGLAQLWWRWRRKMSSY